MTIRGVVIEQFASTAQHGAVHATANDPKQHATANDPKQKALSMRWQVVDNDIRFNRCGGVRTGNRMRLEGNRIHWNGQIGAVGSGTGIVVDSNDIVANKLSGFSPGWKAGETKFVLTDQLQVRDNCVRNDLGLGIGRGGAPK